MIHPIDHTFLDCLTIEGVANRLKIGIAMLADLSNVAPCVGFGGVAKYRYISPYSGKPIWVLQRSGYYDCDAFACDVWQFDQDFTEDQAVEFLRTIDDQVQ